MITRTEYGGWTNNVKLSNGQVELIATLDVGPRIIRFGFVGGQNLFKEFPDELGAMHEDEFKLRGGHRFWTAPEVVPRTYGADNGPVALEELDEYSIRLTPAPEVENCVQKQIDVRLSAAANEVTVTHRVTNISRWEITLAPWALSVMDAGGKALIPLPEQRPHVGNFVPETAIILWPVTDMSDSRIRWGRRYITFTQDRAMGPNKFGLIQRLGWAAYLLHGQLFVKYFDYLPGETYADLGCNFETYSDERLLEVESLGPLTSLAPGESTEHVETWRLFADIPDLPDEASIDRVVLPLVQR